MRIITTTHKKEEEFAVVCLQVQHVAGLPAAAEGRQVLVRLLPAQESAAAAAAKATCGRGGVATFHDQVLLLDYAPVGSIDSVAVGVTVDGYDDDDTRSSAVADVNLAEQLLRGPSPSVLSLVVSGGGGAVVLYLALHHRRQLVITTRRRRRFCCSGGGGSACMAAAGQLLRLSCLQVPARAAVFAAAAGNEQQEAVADDDDDESSGFITIDKGTISRRRPPSDNTSSCSCYWNDEEDSKVEDEFLAMLGVGFDGLDDDLDALIKDAEAELTARVES